jgi:transcriptional regulator with XRE-family HTH domain
MRDARAGVVLTSIAANVRRWRERRSLSQAALAEAASLDLRALQRIEAGAINFGVVALVALADALDVSPAVLVRRAALKPTKPGRPARRRHGSGARRAG